MTIIYCKKLGKQAEQLPSPPLPGALGLRIYHEISDQAWQAWINHQRMLINEYRLNLADKTARDFLRTEMEKFLFTGGSEKPPGYVPEES